MPKTALVAAAINEIPRGLVNVVAAKPGLDHIQRNLLRLSYGMIYLFLLCGDFPQRNGSGHIRVVSVEQRAEIHCDEITVLHPVFHLVQVRAAHAVLQAEDEQVEEGRCV